MFLLLILHIIKGLKSEASHAIAERPVVTSRCLGM